MDGVTVTTKSPPTEPSQGFTADSTAPVASFLSADPADNRLSEIADFFREEGKDLLQADLLWKLRSLENRLGVPSLGEKRIDKIYRYIKLQSQIDSLSKQRDGELR